VLWIGHHRQALCTFIELGNSTSGPAREDLPRRKHCPSTFNSRHACVWSAPPGSANKRRLQKLLLTAAFAADRMAAQHAGIFAYRSADCAREVGPRRAVRYGQFRLGALGRLPAESANDAAVGIPLEDQWARRPGANCALPVQCSVAPRGNYRHSARQAMDLMYRHGGSTSFRRESRNATPSPRPSRFRPNGTRSASAPISASIRPPPGLVRLLEPAASLVLTGGVECANRHLTLYEARKGSGLGTDVSPRRKERPRLNRRQ